MPERCLTATTGGGEISSRDKPPSPLVIHSNHERSQLSTTQRGKPLALWPTRHRGDSEARCTQALGAACVECRWTRINCGVWCSSPPAGGPTENRNDEDSNRPIHQKVNAT